MNHKLPQILVINILFSLVLLKCLSNGNSFKDQDILVRVGDKTITVTEFLQRSDYTSLPPYCNDNSSIHKQIVLNSLIGEKLLAIELGDERELTQNTDFQAYIEGRKEQAMRRVFYNNEFYENVSISTEEIDVEWGIDRAVLSENDIQDRRKQVVERLREEKAWADYNLYINNLMQEWQIQFYNETFQKLINIVEPACLQFEDAKKQIFNNYFWEDSKTEKVVADLPDDLNEIEHLPLFSVDGKMWSVQRFRAQLKRHPLLFRREDIKNKKLHEQFKTAIKEMLINYFITQDAYKKGYDQSPITHQQVNMWKDHMFALYKKNQHLNLLDLDELDQFEIVAKHLTSYIDSIQIKYNDCIEINLQAFKNIQMVGGDLNSPLSDHSFPIIIPSFPIITNNHQIAHGKVIKKL